MQEGHTIESRVWESNRAIKPIVFLTGPKELFATLPRVISQIPEGLTEIKGSILDMPLD